MRLDYFRLRHAAIRFGSIALLCASGALSAQTVEHSNIERLLNAGQNQQALEEAERAIAQFPRDPQLQFLKANAQSALGQQPASEQTLTLLIQQWPELPEPYNNLAVIKAADGQLEQARKLLEQALINKPDYVQAHENLADVLIRIAAEHLQQAQAKAPSPARQNKLQSVEALTNAGRK